MERHAASSRRSWLKLAAIVGVTLVVLLAIVAVAAYFFLPGIRGSDSENTARYFPEDTLVYSWATFSPGIGQGRRMLDLWDRFEELPKFREEVDDLLEDLEDETGIDFEEDILPWVGPDLSFALLEESDDFVALIGVKDHGAASDFLRDLRGYMEDDGAVLEREDDIDGFEVWADWDSDTALALSGDWFLVASAERPLTDVLDLISGRESRSLADSTGFQEARSAMNGDRAMSLYIDLEGAAELFSDLSGSGVDALSDLTDAPDLFSDLSGSGVDAADFSTPDWVAVSAGFIDRGMVVNAVAPIGSDFFSRFPAVDERLAGMLPDDTLFLGAASFEPRMNRWRAELEKYTVADLIGPEAADEMSEELRGVAPDDFASEVNSNSTLAEVLDYAIDLIHEAVDLDLEKDLFDHLGGQAAVAVRDFDFERVEDIEGYAMDVMAMLSYVARGEEGLMGTVDKLIGQLEESSGEEFPGQDRRDIGARHEAVVFDIEDLMGQETAYSPGYVFNHGYMTMGTTERALQAVVDSQNGERATLDGTGEYRRARESLPDALQGLLFLDLQRIIAQMDPDSLDPGYYEILDRGVGAVAAGEVTDADYSRVSFVLTLFPE